MQCTRRQGRSTPVYVQLAPAEHLIPADCCKMYNRPTCTALNSVQCRAVQCSVVNKWGRTECSPSIPIFNTALMLDFDAIIPNPADAVFMLCLKC